jgi:hypothetical protein
MLGIEGERISGQQVRDQNGNYSIDFSLFPF